MEYRGMETKNIYRKINDKTFALVFPDWHTIAVQTDDGWLVWADGICIRAQDRSEAEKIMQAAAKKHLSK
jgi:hypothetical protein